MDEPLPVTPPPMDSGRMSLVLVWVRRIVCISLAGIGASVICTLGNRLYSELNLLSAEWADARNREPVGYVGISSEQPEHKPKSCVRIENDRVYLWAGSGVKGQAGWFDVSATDLPVVQFAYAFGRDRIKTIDYPIYETPGGEVARRIYPERPVLGVVVDGIARAYPVTVMEKVEVINETFGDRAVTVAYCPLIRKDAIYERSIKGEPVSFGTSGYCYQGVHLLYDRKTDSLWMPQEDGLRAITGLLVGTLLPLADESLERLSWGEWQRRHPATQVVVGGDRSRGIPLPDLVATRELTR